MLCDAVVPDMYTPGSSSSSSSSLDTETHAEELLNYNADLVQMYDELPDLGCGLELPSPAMTTSQDMFKILESMGTGIKREQGGPAAEAGGGAYFALEAAKLETKLENKLEAKPAAATSSAARARALCATHLLAYPTASMPTPPASPGQSDAEQSSDGENDEDGEGGPSRSHSENEDEDEDEDDMMDSSPATSRDASPVPVPQRAGLRPRRRAKAKPVSKAMEVLRTAKAKVQFKKRRGWKCTPEYLIDNITSAERDKLIKKGLHIPKTTGRGSLTKAKERLIRKELRKIRNVASAQRHRLEQKEYIDELEARIHERCTSIDELKAAWAADKDAWAAEKAALVAQLLR